MKIALATTFLLLATFGAGCETANDRGVIISRPLVINTPPAPAPVTEAIPALVRPAENLGA